MQAFLLPAIVAIMVFVVMMIIVQKAQKKESIRARVDRLAGEAIMPREDTEAAVNLVYAEMAPSPFAASLEVLLNAIGVNTEAFRKKSQLIFYRAGVGSPDAPIYYLFHKRFLSLIIVGVAAYVALSPAEGSEKMLNIIVAGMLAVVGIGGPDLFLRNMREKREKRLTRSFPDTLDLLLACVESGLALDGALARVCKELGSAYPDITEELNRTRVELTMLNDRPQALMNLSERVNIHVFRLLTTTLIQSERFGTSLAETLRVLSDDSRHTQLMKAEERAGRLPALMTIPLVLLLLPALFIIVLGPAVISSLQVIRSSTGPSESQALR